MSERRVVITGMGAITPVGNDLKTTWQGITEGRSGAGQVTQIDTTGYPSTIAAEVKGFDPEQVVPKKDVRRYDRFSIPVPLLAAQHAPIPDARQHDNSTEKRSRQRQLPAP